jgi:MFS family permease
LLTNRHRLSPTTWEVQPLKRTGAGLLSCSLRLVRVNNMVGACAPAYRLLVFQPTFASLSNIFGRRALAFTALAIFLAGTIVAAVCHNCTQLLIGRSVQGVGGGGLIAISEIIMTDLAPLRLRGLYFAYLGAAWSVGSVIGPLLGGGFAQNVTWVGHIACMSRYWNSDILTATFRDGYSISTFL